MVRILATVVALLGSVLLSSDPVFAVSELSRRHTTVHVGSNSITADRNLTFGDYTKGRTFTVTLDFASTCHVVFSGLTLRSPNPFTPRGAGGAISDVSGTPSPGQAGTTGSVTFDIRFDALHHQPTKDFGVAHLNLVLGVDEDCQPSTGDADGVDESTNIPIKITVLVFPDTGGRSKPCGYATLSTDPATHQAIYEADQPDCPAPIVTYVLVGVSGSAGRPPSLGPGLSIYAPGGADPAAVAAAIRLTGGTAR